VIQFHKISLAVLRLSPSVEWEVKPSPDCGTDLSTVMDMLFRKKEATP